MKSLHEPAAATEAVDSADSLVGQLADDYLRRCEAGEQPSVAEYADRYPEHAERIRGALAMLSLLKHSSAVGSGAGGGDVVQQHSPLSGVLGDFRILHEIGRGGMGVVYEAEQISLGRRVALKILSFASILDPRQLTRFQNEARATATLNHPHIVPVFTTGVERGVHYLAMRLIDGESLANYGIKGTGETGPGTRKETSEIERSEKESPSPRYSGERAGVRGEAVTDAAPHPNPLPGVPGRGDTSLRGAKGDQPESTLRAAALSTLSPRDLQAWYRRVAQWGIEAADALEHAHSLGIVHRDVKPGNLLIDSTGKLWVTDFGLARLPTDAGLTMTGDLLGTLRYMSPEQALARHGLVDHRTDIYSLGATLYELLTGQPAVSGLDRQQILKSLEDREPLPLRKIAPQIPVDLETVVLKALGHEPADRYVSAQQFRDDLRRVIENEPIKAKPIGVVERTRRLVRRHSLLLATFLSVSLFLSISLAVAFSLTYLARNDAVAKAKEAQERGKEAEKRKKEAEEKSEKLQKQNEQNMLILGRMNRMVTSMLEKLDSLTIGGQARQMISEEELAFYEELEKIDGQSPVARSQLALALHRLGHLQIDQKKYTDAETNLKRSIDILEALAAIDPSSVPYANALCHAWMNYGRAALDQKHLDPALERMQASIKYGNRVVALAPEDPEAKMALAFPWGQIGVIHRHKGDRVASLDAHVREIELHAQNVKAEPDNIGYRTVHATAYTMYAESLRAFDDIANAKLNYNVALAKFRELEAERPKDALIQQRIMQATAQLFFCGEHPAAERHRLLSELERFSEPFKFTPQFLNNIAWVACRPPDAAIREAEIATKLAQQSVSLSPGESTHWHTLAVAHYRSGKYNESLAALDKCIAFGNVPRAYTALFEAMCHHRLGQHKEATERFRVAEEAMAAKPTFDAELDGFHTEAAQLLGLAE